MILLTEIPYTCRLCTTTTPMMVEVEQEGDGHPVEGDGVYTVDMHLHRLEKRHCDECGEERVHVADHESVGGVVGVPPRRDAPEQEVGSR